MPPDSTMKRDQLNHCYVCDERFAPSAPRVRCDACGRQFHRECLDEVDGVCPRCGGEAWIDAAEL